MSDTQTPQHVEQEDQEALDEKELDAEIEKSINAVKAGETLKDEDPEGQTEEKEEQETPEGATGSEEESGEKDSDSQPSDEEGADAFRIPEKGKFESDEAYEKRVELADLVRQKKAATTPEAKEALSAKIKETRKEVGRADIAGKFTQPSTENVPQKEDEDPDIAADKARAKELGLATPEDIQKAIQQERFQQSVQDTVSNFVDRTKELSDPDVREVFFDFVDQNFIWQDKTGKELSTVLALAKEAMFKPSETIKDRALKASDVQNKVGAMQFPGGTGTKVNFSSDMKQSIEELKATGMSEEKAIELLSDE